MEPMRKAVRTLLVVAIALGTLGACERLRPIYQVHSESIPVTASARTLDSVEKTIMTAGAAQGWLLKSMQPGLLQGTMRRGKHSAVVRIEFDTRTFSILYADSYRMSQGIGFEDTRYEGQRVIHKRYNKYVRDLERQIQAQFAVSSS